MATSSTVIGIKVKFELITNDRLRKVMFGLEKNTVGNKVTWKIDFEMFEREKKTEEVTIMTSVTLYFYICTLTKYHLAKLDFPRIQKKTSYGICAEVLSR